MANLQEIRAQYPQYNDLNDQQLADAFYKKYYSDMPRDQFDTKIGLQKSLTDKVTEGTEKVLGVLGGPTAAAMEIGQNPKEAGSIALQGIKDLPKDYSQRFSQGWQGLKQQFEKTGEQKDFLPGMYEAGKTALQGVALPFEAVNVPLENTYGRVAAAGARNNGVPNAPSASEMAIVPEVMLPFPGAMKIGAKAAPVNEAGEALARLGAGAKDIKSAKTADQMQDVLKNAVGGAKQDIAGAPPVGERQMAEQVGKGLGEQYGAAKQAEAQAHDLAKEIGETVDVRKIEGIDDVRRIVGQYAGELKKQGMTLAQGLRGEKLKGEREILDLREEIHNMQQADLAGEDLSDLDKAKLELRTKRLENAQAQLAHKESINANLDDQIKEAEATEKQYAKGGLPKEINTGRDLIELKQFLNSVDPQKLSAVEVAQLKQQKEIVDAALKEAGKVGTDISKAGNLPLTPGGPPKFGEQLSKANKATEINAEKYGGDAAKQLGVDKALIQSTKKGARAGVDKAALSNIIASTDGFVDRIKNTGHVDWLRDNLPKKDFDQLMANKLNDTLDRVGTDPEALKANRELIDHILGQAIGVRGQKLKDLQTVLDKLEQTGISLRMLPAQYRGKDPIMQRAVSAVKAGFSTLTSGGKPTAYGISKAAEALEAGSRGEARRLETFRKELLKKPPQNIPGAAIGSVLGVDNAANAGGQ